MNDDLLLQQSTTVLNLVQLLLQTKRFKFLRVDGSVARIERQKRIDLFNNDPSYFCFLLTTKVGGKLEGIEQKVTHHINRTGTESDRC